MSLAAQSFIAASLTGTVEGYLKNGNIGHLFRSETDQALWSFVDTHVRSYGSLPQLATVLNHAKIELPQANEPAEYYRDLLRESYVEVGIYEAGKSAEAFLKADKKNPIGALDALRSAISKLDANQMQSFVTDYRDAGQMLVHAYKKTITGAGETGLKFGWPTLDNMTGSLMEGDVISICGRPALGKAQPLTSKVLLSSGQFVTMGEIKVGDSLASFDGLASAVTAVHPQGFRPVYRLTFGDGRTVEADEDHLWKVGSKCWSEQKVLTTKALFEWRARASRIATSSWVEMFDGEFGETTPTIDPYLLGALIGDGCMTTALSFTSMDAEVSTRVQKALPKGVCMYDCHNPSTGQAKQFSIVNTGLTARGGVHPLRDKLRVLGLWGKKGSEKFLPDEVFCYARADRLAVLQGLMDTDGTVAPGGSTVFGSSSPRLVEDTIRLVRSLGGKGIMSKPKKTTHLDHHRVTIILKNPSEAFYLSRKKGLCRAYSSHDPSHLRIVGMEKISDAETQCISVSHPSRLYITDGYTVTHNTFYMLWIALATWLQGRPPLFVSMEMNPLQIMQRVSALHAQVSIGDIKSGTLTTQAFAGYSSVMGSLSGKDVPFWVVDGNLKATVADIQALAMQLKPGAIFLDGAYLMKHPHEKDRFKRVAENMDLIKMDLAPRAPTFASWQFKRSASGAKKGAEKDLEDIGYTDAIGTHSSLVLGLFEQESIETEAYRKITVLKGRNGESGHFMVNWNFEHTTDFSEVAASKLEDLQY